MGKPIKVSLENCQTLPVKTFNRYNHWRRKNLEVRFFVTNLAGFLFILVCRLFQAYFHHILFAGFHAAALLFCMVGNTVAVLTNVNGFFTGYNTCGENKEQYAFHKNGIDEKIGKKRDINVLYCSFYNAETFLTISIRQFPNS